MLLKTFDFHVPQDVIAQQPAARRDAARLLVYDRQRDAVEHCVFKDVAGYLNPGDCLVINTTRVMPSRLYGRKITGGKVELLLIKKIKNATWECLMKPALKAGMRILCTPGLEAVVDGKDEQGICTVTWNSAGKLHAFVSLSGRAPLPPYIKRDNGSSRYTASDKKYYQTVYARTDGSIAAPTAGLHFTRSLLKKIAASGVSIAGVVLHVGIGTFQRIEVPDITDHHMGAEYYEVSDRSAACIRAAKKNGGKVVAVGTTVVRTLETAFDTAGKRLHGKGWTDIFLYPGYRFKIVDCMITNFHLPCNAPFIMTCAFAGTEKLKQLYSEAIKRKYRFFSYGDAMLIL